MIVSFASGSIKRVMSVMLIDEPSPRTVIVTGGDKLPDWHKFFSEWSQPTHI